MSDLTNLENAVSAGGVGLHQPELEQMRNALEARDAEIARLKYALRCIANMETWPDNLMGDKDIARAAIEKSSDHHR